VGIQFGRRIVNFLKATIVGGLFVLVPVVLLLVIVGKAVEVAYSALRPVVEWLPFDTVGGMSLAFVLGIACVIGLCFAAGLVAKVTLTRRFVRWVESMLLSNMPGYSLMKGVGESLVGVADGGERQAVLVRFEYSSMIGFVMDRLEDERIVVFVPGVPNAMAGTLHIIEATRVEPLGLPIRTVLDFLNRLGVDADKALRNRLAGIARGSGNGAGQLPAMPGAQ
jgi:uncharacterized membrane protein